MSKIDKLRDYLLENYVDGLGDLNLIGLDFSEFEGNVFLCNMKVKGDLFQDYQKVRGDLWQGGQEVGGDLWQSYSEIKGDYHCEDTKVGGEINTNEPTKILKKVTREELAEMGYEVI